MSDPKLITARRKYGAAAIVVYLQLLVMAYRDKGYYLAYGDSDRDGVIWSIKSEVLSGRYEPDAEKIAEMIDCLAAHGLFDGDLFQQGIITSHRIQEHYYFATAGRTNPEVKWELWLLTEQEMREISSRSVLLQKFVSHEENPSFANEKPQFPSDESTHSKVKEKDRNIDSNSTLLHSDVEEILGDQHPCRGRRRLCDLPGRCGQDCAGRHRVPSARGRVHRDACRPSPCRQRRRDVQDAAGGCILNQRRTPMNEKMFCYQCQETAGCKGCTMVGVCGKQPDVAAMQDLLVYVSKGLSAVTTALRREGQTIPAGINHLITLNLFTTITNANFDRESIEARIRATLEARQEQLARLNRRDGLPEAALWDGSGDWEEKARTVGVLSTRDEDIRSLRELITYGLKGLSAYSKHANVLLQDDPEVDAFLQRALAATLDDSLTVQDLVNLTLETGKYGVAGMALLDKANTEAYGNPEITRVSLGVRGNPGILVSGHDLRDLEMLLEQTQGTGVDVYTHSEMLPAHYYPAFKKYPNFVGNYGNAWWKQKEEFEAFHGPILMTTNCIVPPKDSYKDRLYTTGAAGYPGCPHIPGGIGETKDFSRIIEQAKTCPPPAELETGEIVGGFAHAQVFALADRIVEAVKSGAIRKFVVMGGCDGRARSREYYTEFARALPRDTVILTAGCAKYKYNKLALGDIGGIPRVLDAGQCNDSYSLALIALKLQEVFGLDDINDLPIVYNIAWYEQKAVIVLLALLSLGIHNIHLGPTLPAFLSPNVTKVLVEQFGIAGIGSVEEDLRLLIGE